MIAAPGMLLVESTTCTSTSLQVILQKKVAAEIVQRLYPEPFGAVRVLLNAWHDNTTLRRSDVVKWYFDRGDALLSFVML